MELPISYHPSPLDEVIPPLCYAFILAFPIESTRRDQALEALEQGYSRLLRERPYLGGDIVRDNDPNVRPGSLRLIVPSQPTNIKLDVADLTDSPGFKGRSYAVMSEAKMPQRWLDAELLAPCVAGVETTTKIFTGRVNWIEGGCLLAISIAHAAFDARGAFTVIKYWAHLISTSQTLSKPKGFSISQPGKTRVNNTKYLLPVQAIPSSKAPFEHLRSRSELWGLFGLHYEDNQTLSTNATSLPTNIPAAATVPPGSRTCTFSFSNRQSAALKAAATPLHGKHWISTLDAITAHIWASLIRVRFIDKEEPCSIGHLDEETCRPLSSMNIAVDGRRLPGCGFALPRLNNTLYMCRTHLPLSTVLASDALPTLAGAIRQTIETLKSNPDIVRDANALAASIPDVGCLTSTLKDSLACDLGSTSWVDLPFYDLDFGPALGTPRFFRIPRGQFPGICMLPRRPNGDIEVIIYASECEIDRLLDDPNFLRYAKLVSE
ncbi:hypothetical protein F4859DRAFT_496221 [Xylaria cf. heliscus]|nr:hypothetical protein F4859DRAFT_496221 [Xylaria cf. heliscus]